ncbi:asparaginase [Mesorhizobium sp. M6A.T.Ce.TU.002.03.1.1]|uniref:asparaginase n=1 Tax=Mesorhizobium sp. M6A.T.Ce.TU.002.03.1.1 TaxID=2496782 RepID=UPI000FCB2E83|nr:asparaginase [Mesorhizobium sp. M6A.T.Ce.TU.002.03.1.1]RUU32654.1 asparaginase [Mesorhizobium sp. M6A.T.Ce.TU.002.03.1.1]
MACICLITTGGTIASRRIEAEDHVVATVAGEKLRGAIQDVPPGVDIKVDDFMNIVSCAMTLPMAFALAQRINIHLAEDDCIGVVVTHGTDTMEESAYLADLLLVNEKPVVFTGAQRSADDSAADGPRNVTDAVRLAASPLAAGLGAVVLLEQHFHAARDVTKAHTSRVDAFVSRNHGKLGEIDGTAVSVSRRPILRKTFAANTIEPRVDLISMVLGSDDRLIRLAAASGSRAIVLEGFGRGNATPAVAVAVADIIADGVPVFVASRCGEGRVSPIYGNGGGKDLEKAGAVFAGDLTGPKLRILVSVLLGMGMTLEEMRPELVALGG